MSLWKWKMIDTRLPPINTYPLFPEMMAIILWFLSMLPVTAKSWNPSPSTSGVTTGKEISVSECPAVGLWALHLAMPSNNTGKVSNLILCIERPKYLTFVYQLNENAASRQYRTCLDFVLEPSGVAYPKISSDASCNKIIWINLSFCLADFTMQMTYLKESRLKWGNRRHHAPDSLGRRRCRCWERSSLGE